MRSHTEDYKTAIGTGGREIKSKISYVLNGIETTLNDDDIFSIKYTTNGNILKSVMKSAEIVLKNNIPLETVLSCQFGVKVNGEYEYINLGNYVVFSSEKQEELNNYKILCYDKMLYSMVEYSEINVTYPITIKNYLNAICQKLGLTFASVNNTFANYNRQINQDLYINQGYTFRDVLDELAQVTASTICINENDALEVRYINDTHDTINEDYLKNINVTFGKMYGPVNSIVLSRSAESDNVYIQDAESIAQNGLCEIKIKDNQIMNFNDRSDYLPDIFGRLGGLQYYINDYSSPGITYYDLCDRYSVQIGENTYSCIMLNDEINITQGLEENVYTDLLEDSETDYTKADKTDRRINQTYLIVDKQNQAIEGVVSRVDGQDEQIAQIRIQYNEILSKISDIADITTSGESSYASVNLVEVNESQPINIKIHPITQHIAYDYPHNDYPQIDYPKSRTLRFTNTTTDEIFDWLLPTDLWYYDSENYDELELSYGDGTNSSVIVTRKCKINADASISLLDTPTTETYTYPDWLVLTDGDYTISLIDNTSGYLFVQLMAKNIYTTQFYTKAETNSLISQTASNINLSVDTKLSNYSTTNEMNSAIELKANQITSSVSETYTTKTTTNQLSSRITQNASDITSEVTRATNSESSLSTRIKQTTTGISLTVNNGSTSSGIVIGITKEDGTTTQAQGTIQMTGLVKFTDLSNAGSTTINGSNITTGIIKSSNYVSGSAGTSINLSNGVIDTKNFKVSSSGNITSTGGTIGGWTISQNDIHIKNSSNNEVIIADGSNTNQDVLVIRNGSNYPFYLRANGYLYANNVQISGNITATSGSFTGSLYTSNGTFGNWTINGDGIYSSNAQIFPDYLGFKYNGTGSWTSQPWWRIGQNASDKNLKKNIEKLEDKFDKFFNELRPISFKWKESENDKTHIGFIAQDIQESERRNNLDLDLVYGNENDDLLNLDKQEIIALNTWQIQKLKDRVQRLEELING